MQCTRVLSISIALGFLSSAPAMAEGWYAGLNLGMAVANLNPPNGTDRDQQTVLGAVAGYQFNPYFGVEAQYTGAGKVTDNLAGSVKVDAASLSMVGSLPLNPQFNLLAKLGIANTQSTVSQQLGSLQDAGRTAATVGIGAEYVFDGAFAMRVGVDHYGARVDTVTGHRNFSSNVSSVGVVYRF